MSYHPGNKLEGLSAHQEDRWKNIHKDDLTMALRVGAGVVCRMFAPIFILVLIAGICMAFAHLNVATCSGKQTLTVHGSIDQTLREQFQGNHQAAMDYVEKAYDNDLSRVGSTFSAPRSCG